MKASDLKYDMIMGILRFFALFPLGMLYLFSDILCFFAHRILRYRVKVVRKNLAASFPEKSAKELRKIENSFYHYLCDSIVETVKLLHISNEEIYRRVSMTNTEVVTDIIGRKKPIILFLGHLANWEWVPALILMFGSEVPMGALYKPLRNKVMDRVTKKIRSRFPTVLIPAKTAFRSLLQLKRDNPSFMIGFIGDQRPVGINVKHWTEFMNQHTSFMTGGETIGDKVGAEYVYVEALRLKRGYMQLNYSRIEPDSDNTEDFPYTRKYFEMLEKSIRREPAYWLWSHNRWKPLRRPDDGREEQHEGDSGLHI